MLKTGIEGRTLTFSHLLSSFGLWWAAVSLAIIPDIRFLYACIVFKHFCTLEKVNTRAANLRHTTKIKCILLAYNSPRTNLNTNKYATNRSSLYKNLKTKPLQNI